MSSRRTHAKCLTSSLPGTSSSLKKPTLEKDISEKEKEKYQEEFEHFQQELDKKKEEFQKDHPDLQGQPGKLWLGRLCRDTWVCTVCLISAVSAHSELLGTVGKQVLSPSGPESVACKEHMKSAIAL